MWIQIKNTGIGKGKRTGFTLVELMVTILISVIIVSAIGVMIADSSGWFSDSYRKINSQSAIESLVARKTFESIVRQSCGTGLSISPDGTSVEINYYSSPGYPLDSYASFYTSGTDLILEKGTLGPKTTLSSETVCSNVSQCTFRSAGSAVQMILLLDDGENQRCSLTSAILHN